MHPGATTCPQCGATGKSKVAAGLLALFLGLLGIHRFYLGQIWGLAYLLPFVFLFWTGFVPLILIIVCLVEAIVFFCTNDIEWNQKYGFARTSPQSTGTTNGEE